MDADFLSIRTKKNIGMHCCGWFIFTCYFIQITIMAIFAFRNPDPVDSYYAAESE